MKTVKQVTIAIKIRQVVSFPKNAQIIASDITNGKILFCILIEGGNPDIERRTFMMVQTDDEIELEKEEELQHICTCQMQNNNLIHIFEIIKF